MRRLAVWMALGLIGLAAEKGVRASTLVQFRTMVGSIDVELFDQEKPVTTANFLRYVEAGAYTNTFLHRCVPGFVVQGGGLGSPTPALHQWFADYFNVDTSPYGPITNEFGVGRRISNTYGTIAMAKLGDDPNSATSQWFFNLTNNSANLDAQNGGFTVFGRVLTGTNVLEWFNRLQWGMGGTNPAGGLVNLTWWYGSNAVVFSELPVLYSGFTPPNHDDLIYVDIVLLNTLIKISADGAREVSWNSVSNRQNYVEFSSQLPAVWLALTNVPGTGKTLKIIDTAVPAGRRFYRVRVDY